MTIKQTQFFFEKSAQGLSFQRAQGEAGPLSVESSKALLGINHILKKLETVNKSLFDQTAPLRTLTATLIPKADSSDFDLSLSWENGQIDINLTNVKHGIVKQLVESLETPPPLPAAPQKPATSWFTGLFNSQPSPKPADMYGLYNPDNNCFMNAVFQMIMNDDTLCRALIETYTPLARTHEAYKTFIDVVALYKSGSADPLKKVDLDPLRHLLKIYASKTNANASGWQDGSMGDAEEFLNALLDKVDLEKFNLGFRNGFRRTGTPLGTALTKSKDILDPKNTLTLQLEIREKTTGQQLIDEQFKAKPHTDKPILDIDEYTCQIETEQRIFGTKPERLIIQVKRFTPRGKIEHELPMARELTIQGERYNLKSIVQHGGAHYWSYLNKNGTWYTANDTSVTKTDPARLEDGLNRGYLYFYEKI